MATDQIAKAVAMPDGALEATVAIVTAHLRTTATSAAQVPGLIRQVHKAVTGQVDRKSRDQGSKDQEPRHAVATEPSRSDRLASDAGRRGIAEQDAVFPWSGWPGPRGPRAGTRIGASPRERFRSRSR